MRKTLNLIPSRVYRFGAWSIFASFLSSIAIYGVAMMLQVFVVLLNFSTPDQISQFLVPLTQNVTLFFLTFAVLVLFQGAGQFLMTFLNIAFAETFNYEVRKQFLNALFDHRSYWKYDLGATSNIISEVIPKSASYVTSVARFLTLLIQVLILGTLSIISMPLEFMITIASFSILTPAIVYLNRRSRGYGSKILKRSSELNVQLMRSVKNFLYLKILGIEHEEKTKTITKARSYYEEFMRSNVYYSLANALPPTFSTIVVVYLFYFFSLQGSSTPLLLTLFYLLYRFAQTLSQMVGITNAISRNRPNFNTIIKVLEDASLINSEKNGYDNSHETVPDTLSINAKDISFSYSLGSDTNLVFKNLNIDLPENKMLVIKGASGSGKTTLLMVLIGVLTHSKGTIKWGDVYLEQFENKLFRKKIGYMGPEPFIISGTVRDNLCYGLHEQPSTNEIWNACKDAEADGFLKQLDKGLNAPLSELGEGLSMGQKQRLGMASALLRKPQILILDEVTANLDKKTEQAIIKNIDKMKTNMTILVSTHSDAFDNIADQIVELE